MKVFGLIVIVWAVFFQFGQTEYFGNNFLPATYEEFVCDMTSLILLGCGIILIKR